MSERTSPGVAESDAGCYVTLEQWARGQIQTQLQHLLEEEVTTFLGRALHARRSIVALIDPPIGRRNGYDKPRAFSMLNGTVTVRRMAIGRLSGCASGLRTVVRPH